MADEQKIVDKYGYLYKVGPDHLFAIRFVDNKGTPHEKSLRSGKKRAVEREYARRLRLDVDECLGNLRPARLRELSRDAGIRRQTGTRKETIDRINKKIANFKWRRLENLHNRCLHQGKGSKKRRTRNSGRRGKGRRTRKLGK